MYFSRAFHNYIIRHDDFTDGIHRNVTAFGIFDRIHMSVYVSLYLRILKGQVGCLHGAVDEF